MSILEAAHLSKQGENVVIIDDRKEIGGAWGTVKYEGLPELEIGCHIWDVAPGVFEFLTELLGLNLKKMAPSPKIQKGTLLFPYDWKMNLISFKHATKSAAHIKFKSLLKDLSSPGHRISILPSKYLYPVNGAVDMKQALSKILELNNIQIINTRLSKLDIGASVSATLADSTNITADNVVVTSLTNIDEVIFENNVQKIDSTLLRYIHFHLVVKDLQPTKFSYVRVMGNELIHRISDMSLQVSETIQENEKLICIGVYENEFDKYETGKLVDLIFEQLKELKFVSNKAELKSHHHNIYPASYTDKVAIRKIESESNGKLKFLHSTNLMYGIHKELPRWKYLVD